MTLSRVSLIKNLLRTISTFPEPVTPNVASRPSLPTVPARPSTPASNSCTCAPLKTSSCDASSSNTLVNSNFSIALLRKSFVGGLTVICVGILLALSSTSRKRSSEDVMWGGRKRRYTSNSDIEGLGGGSMLFTGREG